MQGAQLTWGGSMMEVKAASVGRTSGVHDALAEGQQLVGVFGTIKSKNVRQRVIELVRALAAEAGQ